MLTAKKNVQSYRFEADRWEPIDTQAITETSVTLNVNGEDWLVFMCTPLELEALAVGFLYNEGLIRTRDEIASVRVCPSGDTVDVWLTHAVEKPAQWRRTSGCTGGVTGVSGQDPDAQKGEKGSNPDKLLPGDGRGNHARFENDECAARLAPSEITALVTQLSAAQDLYPSVGGVHTSALSDGQRILFIAEDIGRHNTLDKIAGRCVLEDIRPLRRVLITTGRVSSEMLQKATRLNATMVISRTAPSSLSIEMAEQSGITLIGYARRDRFTVYSHPERVMALPGE